jgi:ATP-dependent exoDNAse (exonuclease V) beta subunit
MTVHRAKGLEFEIVCVADLGRGPRWPADIIRVGRDGELGLRLARPGTARREPALGYRAIGEERAAAEAREERRLFYVAMTRAKERLVLSGAARLDGWRESATPIAWIAPALLGDMDERLAERQGVTDSGVRFSFLGEGEVADPPAPPAVPGGGPAPAPALAAVSPPVPAPAASPVASLSYSSLAEYRRCGYRFYAERVLGLPAREAAPSDLELAGHGLSGTERGVLLHALLERLDFRRPISATPATLAEICRREGIAVPGQAESEELVAIIAAFVSSPTRERLARATGIRREERFAFAIAGGVLVNGAFDVLAREPTRMLVVDYKSDRLEGAAPADVVAARYGDQRLIYALAVLRAGAPAVEVQHLFLERPDQPAIATFTIGDAPRLEAELERLASGVLGRDFSVTDAPHRAVCAGCPAEGGMCSWPLEMTRREAPDRLF